MLKIVKITANFPPKKCGIADYTRILCEHIADANEDVSFDIITSADQNVIKSGYAHQRIKVLPLIDKWSFCGIAKVRKMVKWLAPDIIHIEYNKMQYRHKIAINFLPYLLKRDNPTYKIVITFHDLPSLANDKDLLFWLTSLLLLTHSDRVVLTNLGEFNSKVLEILSIKGKCALIPVGSNIAKKAFDRGVARREFNIPGTALVISFFGFIRGEKDFERLLRAFAGVLQTGCNARLLMIGGILNSKIASSLKRMSQRLKISDKVVWTGYQEEDRVSGLLSASDMAALPYDKGITTNSGALAACVLHGIPVVATRNRVISDVIKDGRNLILASPGNLRDLTSALLRAASDEVLRKKIAENMTELAEYLSWRKISEKVSFLYRDLEIRIKASIVICTYKRPELARGLLTMLNNQRYRNFEAIVVCQGDKNDLEKIRGLGGLTYPVKYCYEPDPNLPRARNIGIREASGEVILFLDDDIRPDDAMLGAHLANYEDPATGIVGGRVIGRKYKKVPDHKIGTVRRFDGRSYAGFYKDIRRSVMHVIGTNLSVRRKLALDIGGFDERFERTAYFEDMDFCLRALRRGFKVIFDPMAVIEHLNIPSGGCRSDSEKELMYWLYHNHTLMFLNNFNKLFYPIVVAEYAVRIILRSFLWRDPDIVKSAFSGIFDGYRAYTANPGRSR